MSSTNLEERVAKITTVTRKFQAIIDGEITLLEAVEFMDARTSFKVRSEDPLFEQLEAADKLQRRCVEHILTMIREQEELVYETFHKETVNIHKKARGSHPARYHAVNLPGRSIHAKFGTLAKRRVILYLPNALERARVTSRFRYHPLLRWALRAYSFGKDFYCLPPWVIDLYWLRHLPTLQGNGGAAQFRRVDVIPTHDVLEAVAVLFNPTDDLYKTPSKAYEAASRL